MSRKKNKKKPVPNAFQDELEEALKHFGDPEWLGEHSSLAAPYFLGEYLLERGVDVGDFAERGYVLREVLRESVNELAEQGESGAFYARLLRLSFLNPERLTAPRIADELAVGRSSYFREKPKAVEQLAVTLFRRLKPALRLESPTPQQKLVGQDEVLRDCVQALKKGQSVGLSGPGGVGKTTLGVHIAAKMKMNQPPVPATPRRAFWFTFRLGVNDHAGSLLFALGHFLARQGASSLWAQLIAEQTHFDMNAALASMRYDLESLASAPLLCFDEVDLLRPAELEAHASLWHVLESLKGLTPLLFIGQQLPMDVDKLHRLSGLSLSSIESMLRHAEIDLSAQEMARLNAYTQGNPRLLELFMALHRSGEEMGHLLAELESTPSLEFLLRRIWQRLSQQEQDLLASLVPFRRPVPSDAWSPSAGEQAALQQLIERRLLQRQGEGEVALLPAFRGVLYKSLPADGRQAVHLRAATIRAKRGEYTAAAYHYLQAGETEVAFRLWHIHQEQEINQGQAGAALSLFEGMAEDQLSKADQKELGLWRARLLNMSGEHERSRETLMSIEWDSSALAAQAKRLEGDIAELKSELEAAADAYRAGLETVETLLSEKARFHKNLGWVAKREKKPSDAWREAMLADYEAQNLKGYVQEDMGHYDEARAYYEKAIELAEKAAYDYGSANTYNNLGRLLTWQRKFELAEGYLKKAYDSFKRRGEITHLTTVTVNQTLLFLLSNQHHLAIAPAKEALNIFERLGQPLGRDIARINLAEAYLGTGDLENAEAAAQPLIQAESSLAYNAWWVLGEVRLAQGRHADAAESLKQAIHLAEARNDRLLEGYAWRSQGKVSRAQGDQQAAQRAFGRAIEVFENLNLPDEVQQTHSEQR